MTKYSEILRLKSLGFSERNIALSVPCSRNTVSKVLTLAAEKDVSWPFPPAQQTPTLNDSCRHLRPPLRPNRCLIMLTSAKNF